MSHNASEADLDPNTSQAQLNDLVGAAGSVLDVSVEDVRSGSLAERFAPASYDVVVLADVIQHATDPGAVLREATGLLHPDGRIVLSAPNVTHGSVRLALLQGSWPVTDDGADRAQSHLYSRQGLLDLLQEAGLTAEELRGTLADPLAVGAAIDTARLPAQIVEWVRDQPDAFVHRFQVRARRLRDGEDAAVPELVTAVAVSRVRPHDEHTEERVRAGRDELLMKDHVLGLQAVATSARARAAEMQARVKRMRARMERAEAQATRLRNRVAELEADLARPGWKRAARSAVRRLRG